MGGNKKKKFDLKLLLPLRPDSPWLSNKCLFTTSRNTRQDFVDTHRARLSFLIRLLH